MSLQKEYGSADLAGQPLEFARKHRSRFVAELSDFIRIPSISAQPAHAKDLNKCALWLVAHLRALGLERAQSVQTTGHPIVYAEWRHAPDKPTLLVYGHYDVQPPDPLPEWRSPPFDPVVRGENLYGRGACDDKGQLFVHLKAVEAWLRTRGALPVNLKCLFEGEEEIGSPSLQSFLRQYRSALASDAILISDMTMPAPDQPAITYALRGALSLELEVRGPRHDLHSGLYGGAVPNPLQVLCEMIARLHDADGRIAIPRFYDRVRQWSEAERAYMAEAGPTDDDILHSAESSEGKGEPGYTLYERTTIRPSLSVNGIVGGYQGAGAKAVIPARVLAKLNFRLVPDQDPTEIAGLLQQHIERTTPPGVTATVRQSLRAKPVLVDRGSPVIGAAACACRRGFGRPPVFLRSGGSIPVVTLFQQILRAPTVLLGFGLPDDALHAPNEKFHLPNFYHGIATSIHFLAKLATTDVTRNLTSNRLKHPRPHPNGSWVRTT